MRKIIRGCSLRCVRETVVDSNLRFGHTTTQQQTLIWRTRPRKRVVRPEQPLRPPRSAVPCHSPSRPPFRSVLVLKKLGNELLPHLMETLSFLRARPPTPRACAHSPQPQSRGRGRRRRA